MIRFIAEWMQKLDLLADSVRSTGLFRAVAVHSLPEDWEDKRTKSEKEIRHFVETHSQYNGPPLCFRSDHMDSVHMKRSLKGYPISQMVNACYPAQV